MPWRRKEPGHQQLWNWSNFPIIFQLHHHNAFLFCLVKLEQLERLRSEDTPRRLMITHTIESYWIPSQKKTKSKLQI